MSKPRVIKDYDKLPEEVVEQVKLVYPRGFKKYLVPFVNKAGEKKMGLPFETNDYYYLIRMTEEKAVSIIRNDDDYEHGQLKSTVKADYEDKHDDIDFLDEFNANDDNDLGMDDEEIIDPDELPGEENYSEEEEDIY
ncbi:hypothetical protein CEQ90_09335 [Lewinellaceae bacterium SD302]|nr:hypothetical protein CEQ90_09335 [Lewinellaceae bacterium SD302]